MTPIVAAILLFAAVASGQQMPDVAAQKRAMQKLAFLVGDWTGEATVAVPSSGPVRVHQTEHVEFKLDGLIMVMEGTGRNDAGEVRFRAFAVIAYDDATRKYHFRSYNDGRYLDTDLEVTNDSFEWGYIAGPAKVRFTMHLTPKGEWTETGELVVGSGPPRKILEMILHK